MDRIPVIGFAGYSGSGKTTLLEKLIPLLREKGIRTAVIKHDAHGLTFGDEGKDSRRFYHAGADISLVTGPAQTAVFYHRPLSLEEAVAGIRDVDLILIEGYKHCNYPQIGISRRANGKGLTAEPEHFLALVTDEPPVAPPVPVFGLNEVEALAAFLLRCCTAGKNNLPFFPE